MTVELFRSIVFGVAVMIVPMVGVACSNDRPAAATDLAEVDPVAFSALAESDDTVVINVHVPYEGEIDGTDAFIPYDEIVGHPELPTDRAASLLLYCRSGNMSEQAGKALIAAGYTDVTHLAGGLNAWEADGRTLITMAGR